MPPLLQAGCRPQVDDLTRIGLSISATTDGTNAVKSPLLENIVGVMGDIYMVTDQSFDKVVCVLDDESSIDQAKKNYLTLIDLGMDILLGPSSGEFNQAVEDIARLNGTRIILWSLQTQDYMVGSLEGTGHFTSSIGLIDRVEAATKQVIPTTTAPTTSLPRTTTTRRGFRALQANKTRHQGRALQAKQPPDNVRNHSARRTTTAMDLPLVLHLQARNHYYLLGLLRLLRPLTTSLTIFAQNPSLPFRPADECYLLEDMARDLGYTSIVLHPITTDNFMDMGRIFHSIVVWCLLDSTWELIHVGEKGLRWDPDIVVLSRPNTINMRMMNVPAHSINYVVEPTLWPSIEELLNQDDGLIWGDYLSWWAWHTHLVGTPPPLMSYQFVAALQVCQKMMLSGYLTDSTEETQDWDWRNEPVWTMYGDVRFKDDGTRLNVTLAVRQVKPWPLDTNSTKSAYERRYYSASMLQVVSSEAEVRRKFALQSEPARTLREQEARTTLINHPINSNTFMMDLVFPRRSWNAAELEVFPCKTGCQFSNNRCVPCERGNYRGQFDVRCRQCEEPGEFADVPGRGRCRVCPTGATCDPDLRHAEPEANPGFYKWYPRDAVPMDTNYSSAVWERYCSLWSDTTEPVEPGAEISRGPNDEGPEPSYTFFECSPRELCLGSNRCLGHNSGLGCMGCEAGFSFCHLQVDTRVCIRCPSLLDIMGKMLGVALLFFLVMVILLGVSYMEVKRIDSIKGPLLLSLLHHLHMMGLISQMISRGGYRPIEGRTETVHSTLAMILTRPFRVTFFDCLFDKYNKYDLVGGLLWIPCVAYFIGIVLCFIVRPLQLLLASLFGILSCRCRQSSAGGPGSLEAPSPLSGSPRDNSPRSVRSQQSARQFIRMHSGFATKISLAYSLKRALVWTIIFYPVILHSAREAFTCVGTEAVGTFRLDMQLDISCGDLQLSRVQAASLAILTIFGLGFPLAVFLVLHHETLNIPLIQMRTKWGLLIGGYKQRFYAFEVLKICRTWIINLILMLSTGSGSVPRSVCLGVLLVFGFVEMTLEPHNQFHRGALPKCEVFSTFSLCIILVAGILEQTLQDNFQSWMPEPAYRFSTQAVSFVVDYGDIMYLIWIARCILFSHIALPLHIASRTGAVFSPHIRMFLFSLRWMFTFNSVGVVTEKTDDGQQDTYLYVGALASKEKTVMKIGIGEVMHIAVHMHDKIHPTLIVNALDEAARRAGQNRAAMRLQMIAVEQHGSWLLRTLNELVLLESVSSTVSSTMRMVGTASTWAGRSLVRSSSGPMRSRSILKATRSAKSAGMSLFGLSTGLNPRKKAIEDNGFYTVEELYTAMQDVVMDMMDNHPLLRNVAEKDASGPRRQKKDGQRGNHHADRRPVERQHVANLKHVDQDRSGKKNEYVFDDGLIERLAEEREAEARKRAHRFTDNLMASSVPTKPRESRLNMNELVLASAEAAGTRRQDLDERLEELRHAVADRRERVRMMKLRLEEHRRVQDPSRASPTSQPVDVPAGEETGFLQLLSMWNAPERDKEQSSLSMGRRSVSEMSDQEALEDESIAEVADVTINTRGSEAVQAQGPSPPQAAQPAPTREPDVAAAPEAGRAPGHRLSSPEGHPPTADAEPRQRASQEAGRAPGHRLSSPEGHPPTADAEPRQRASQEDRASPRPKAKALSGRRHAAAAPAAEPPLPPPETPAASSREAAPTAEAPEAARREVPSAGPSSARSTRSSSSGARRRKAAWKDILLAPRKPAPIPEDAELRAGADGAPAPLDPSRPSSGQRASSSSAQPGAQEPPPASSSFAQSVAEDERGSPAQREATRSTLDSARSSFSGSSRTDDAVRAEELAYLWSTPEARQEAQRQRSPTRTDVPTLELPSRK